jgi:hypothetical protein
MPNWSKAGYTSFDDCVAKNSDKDNPQAYCGEIRKQLECPEESRMHPDFLKIYTQFLTQIKDEDEAHNRYVAWVKALNLDETKSYGQSMREQFRWVRRHVDFDLWKEDARAKYWAVEAAFPLESMNENVYTLLELQEGARTVKGKMVNVNHKFQLPTIDIVAAKYEDGVAECILRVPKQLRCPICSKDETVNDLVESGGIVNVSLEAVCTLKSDDPHKCEGMEFTGLSLLTKDTLPGIPLTRMIPLENIMVEALQTSSMTPAMGDKVKTQGEKTMKKKRIRVKAKVKERAAPTEADRAKAHFNISDEKWDSLSEEQKQAYIDKLPPRGTAEQNQPEPYCPEHQHYDMVLKKCVPDSTGAELPATLEQGTQVTVVQPPKPTTVEPDEHGQCPEGWKLSTVHGTGEDPQCVPMTDEEKAQQVEDSIEPDLAKTVAGTPATPDKTKLKSGPAYGHAGTPTMSTRETTYAGEPGGVKREPEIIQPGDEVPPHMHKEPTPTNVPTTPAPIEPTTQKAIPPPPVLDMPEGDTTMHPTEPAKMTPKEPHVCPDGYHFDTDLMDCVADAPITEQVRRIKAETKLARLEKNVEELEATWIQKYTQVSNAYNQLIGANAKQDKFYKERLQYERGRNEKLTRDYQEAEIAKRDINNQFADLSREKRRIENFVTDLRVELEDVKKKYHGALATNLDLIRKNTQSNEDYLALAKTKEELEDKLNKARIHAKKTLKLKL